jgi:hypothetical protein
MNQNIKKHKIICRHDYKNAIPVGNIDHICPLCKQLLDPNEWFFMNSFDFVEVKTIGEIKTKKNIKKS